MMFSGTPAPKLLGCHLLTRLALDEIDAAVRVVVSQLTFHSDYHATLAPLLLAESIFFGGRYFDTK